MDAIAMLTGSLARVARADPPVTLGMRLASIVDDVVLHARQAPSVRGPLGA